MRDLARIARITTKLAVLWARMPNMRLGQLCDVIMLDASPRGHEHDWNTEDDVFEAALDVYSARPDTYVWPKTL